MTIRNNNQDIYVDQFDCGVDVEFKLSNTDGTPYDLQDYEIQFIVKPSKDVDDEKAIANKMLEYTDNSIVVTIDEDLSSNPVGLYYYAIRLIKADFVYTIVQAKLIIDNNTFDSRVTE